MNKIQLWIITLTICIGMTTMVALAAPKNGNTKAIKYNLPCLVDIVEDPLNQCKIPNIELRPIDIYLAQYD